jgi:hypothetical protein
MRQLHSKAKHLIFVYEAGPCGYWLLSFSNQKRLRLLGGRALIDFQKGG